MKQDREDELSRKLVKRLSRWQKGQKTPPLKIDAEVGKDCNLSCKYCPHSQEGSLKNQKDPLHVSQWLRLVEEAETMGIKQWNFEGLCEPMSDPERTMRLIQKIKKAGIYGSLTTNGTLWSKEQLARLVDIG